MRNTRAAAFFWKKKTVVFLKQTSREGAGGCGNNPLHFNLVFLPVRLLSKKINTIYLDVDLSVRLWFGGSDPSIACHQLWSRWTSWFMSLMLPRNSKSSFYWIFQSFYSDFSEFTATVLDLIRWISSCLFHKMFDLIGILIAFSQLISLVLLHNVCQSRRQNSYNLLVGHWR